MITIAIRSAFCMFAFIAAAAAQDAPTPLKPADPAQRQSVPGPTVPPGQFAACVGIIDLQRRDACIARQTSKGNPAVPGPETGSDRPPPAHPKTDPQK